MPKRKDSIINEKLCVKKVHEIGTIIDGVRVPDAMSILGTVIMNIIENCIADGHPEVREFVLDSLDCIYESVEDFKIKEPEEEIAN